MGSVCDAGGMIVPVDDPDCAGSVPEAAVWNAEDTALEVLMLTEGTRPEETGTAVVTTTLWDVVVKVVDWPAELVVTTVSVVALVVATVAGDVGGTLVGEVSSSTLTDR